MVHKPKKREMFGDPEPPDEKDPVFRKEMFSLYQSQGMKPEELDDEEERRLYANWLKSQPLTTFAYTFHSQMRRRGSYTRSHATN